MLIRLPTIGRRLGPGGYGKRFLPGFHTNHANANKSVKAPRRMSYGGAVGILGAGKAAGGSAGSLCVRLYMA